MLAAESSLEDLENEIEEKGDIYNTIESVRKKKEEVFRGTAKSLLLNTAFLQNITEDFSSFFHAKYDLYMEKDCNIINII